MLQRATQSPPDVGGVWNDVGFHQSSDIALIIGKGLEHLRSAAAGHHVVGSIAVTEKASLAAGPKGGRSRKREQDRNEWRHAIHQVDAEVGLWNLHMDMKTTNWVRDPHHPKVFDDLGIAFLSRNPLLVRQR